MSSGLVETKWVWKNGDFIPWGDAKVHVLSLAVQFGSSIFEGIRCYKTSSDPAIFRLQDHMRRLKDSCAVYRIDLPFNTDALTQACAAIVTKNDLEDCYIRPTVVRGYGAAGLNPNDSPIEIFIAAWPWGTYLGADALENGVDVCVSTWNRPAPNTFPSNAKAGGHYTNAQLIKMEAMTNGYAEAIALGPSGLVSEGSGQNIFLVRDGLLRTPQTDGTWLHGITRDSVIRIAADLGIPVQEQTIPREMLYTADELFFAGTATEVTPIRSVDRIQVGAGTAGPITKRLQARFLQTVRGEVEDKHGWLTRVRAAAAVS